jgi:hypothetical protein
MNFRLVWVGSDDDPPEQGSAAEKDDAAVHPLPLGVRYERRGTGMIRREQLENGRGGVTAISNFNARIVQDLVVDDDAGQSRLFGIEAELGAQKLTFAVPATEFSGMGWVLKQLGPQAIVYPGQQQHARAAIQSLSGSVRQERIFTHLGWKKHDGQWVYLHAGGAVGAQGSRGDLRVELPAALQHYQVDPPDDSLERGNALRASLLCLSVAPDCISFPLLAGVYRAVLGKADFSLFLTGRTGVFNSHYFLTPVSILELWIRDSYQSLVSATRRRSNIRQLTDSKHDTSPSIDENS